jgi:uncharacterized peroxidase-related enzyme
MMAYIQTIPQAEATGLLKEVYDRVIEDSGVVDNGVRAFSLRPAAHTAWQQLRNTIQSNMDSRRYELVTLAAAASLQCSYCTLAHGAILVSEFFSPEQVELMTHDYRNAGLEPADVAMMAYAEKIARHAYKVTPEDLDGLRAHGFSDADILDIALTAAARSFLSKVLDAVGVEPDGWFMDLQPELRQALTVGRPFGEHSR